MSKDTISVTVISTRKLRLPMLPNFILTDDGGKVSIADLTQDQLKQVGTLWTEALMRKAKSRADEACRLLNKMLSAESTGEQS